MCIKIKIMLLKCAQAYKTCYFFVFFHCLNNTHDFRALNVSLLKHIQLFLRLIRVLKAPFRYLLCNPLFLQALHHD